MGRKTGKILPLPWRVAGNALLLLALLGVTAGVLLFPRWKLDRELSAAMAERGEPGVGRLLWEGEMQGYGEGGRAVLRQGEDRLYLGQLTTYEGRPYLHVFTGALPDRPDVTVLLNDAYLLLGDFIWRPRGETACQLIGVNLPEGTAGGRLTVTLGPEVVRETEGLWDQGLLVFAPPRQWVEYEWGLKKDGILPYHTGTMADRPYTLTLWDETGTVIAETSGTLGSIWGR